MNKELDKKIISYLEEKKDDFISDLRGLLKFNSIKNDDDENKPFGKENAAALDYMMELCENSGLECRNIDYYCMDATCGEGDEVIASLSHLDIVPIGDGWQHDPLAGEIEGDLIFGRGTTDDKGPTIAVLYALKALLASGVSFKRKVRLIFGCDEECGMSDMKYYLTKCKAPDYAFSPDAAFPTIHAEKSVINGKYEMKIESSTIVKFIEGGTKSNVVPGTAKAVVTSIGCFQNDPDIVVEDKNGVYEITATGEPAHAANPQEGKNAILTLCKYLARILPKDDAYKKILYNIFDAFNFADGSGMKIDCYDKPTGALTINLGVIEGDNKSLSCVFDIRHPVTLSTQILHEKLQTSLIGFELIEYFCSEGLFLDKEHPLIKTLQGIYKDITGDKSSTFAIGGGTYARTLPCAVAFGPGFKDGKSKGAHMHDECASIKELLKAARIYAHSIFELANISE